MSPDRNNTESWQQVLLNKTYRPGALCDNEEGLNILWHSPRAEHSSQVFCVSAFGSLRKLPDRDKIIGHLFFGILPATQSNAPWTLMLERAVPELLGETGSGKPTYVDVFCDNASAVVCIESKFLCDAKEGFGGCGQIKTKDCLGFYGLGSDNKCKTSARCRLEVTDGMRAPRRYWELGRNFFLDTVFQSQKLGDVCPFASSNFQLMRNFLFAAESAGASRSFGVLCIVPEKTSATCREQVDLFRETILKPEFRSRIAVVTYDALVDLLLHSAYHASQELGRFLQKRMKDLL